MEHPDPACDRIPGVKNLEILKLFSKTSILMDSLFPAKVFFKELIHSIPKIKRQA